MIKLENNNIIVEIATFGAELQRVYSKKQDINYLWDASKSWGRKSPVLFPNIGSLTDNIFLLGGKEYKSLPHGFSRDMEFEVHETTENSVTFKLNSSDETAIYFPYEFSLYIKYTISDYSVDVEWTVENNDSETIYFSIGAHPGFKFLENTNMSDYKFVFDKEIDIKSRLVKGRYLTDEFVEIEKSCKEINLSKKLLQNDAIVLENSGVKEISLVNESENYCLKITAQGFPVVALWTNPDEIDNAKFVCIEPWYGINSLLSDKVEDIKKKYLVNKVEVNDKWCKKYTITVN